MNLGVILATVLAQVAANPQGAQDIVAGLINLFKATTAPTPILTPGVPGVPGSAVKKAPHPAVKQLQAMLNRLVKPQPPLDEDGWLGAKTEDAIMKGLEMLKPYEGFLGMR